MKVLFCLIPVLFVHLTLIGMQLIRVRQQTMKKPGILIPSGHPKELQTGFYLSSDKVPDTYIYIHRDYPPIHSDKVFLNKILY